MLTISISCLPVDLIVPYISLPHFMRAMRVCVFFLWVYIVNHKYIGLLTYTYELFFNFHYQLLAYQYIRLEVSFVRVALRGFHRNKERGVPLQLLTKDCSSKQQRIMLLMPHQLRKNPHRNNKCDSLPLILLLLLLSITTARSSNKIIIIFVICQFFVRFLDFSRELLLLLHIQPPMRPFTHHHAITVHSFNFTKVV